MAVKLKSILKTPLYGLILKGVVFAALLFWFSTDPSAWRGVILFLIGLWLYSLPFFNVLSHLPELLILFFLALRFSQFSFFGVVLFAFIFAVIVGLKNLLLHYRDNWYHFLVIILSYLVLLDYFMADKSEFFVLKWLVTILLLGVLFRSLLVSPKAVYRVAFFLILFLISQLLWIVSWLPIGFFNSANLLILVLYFLIECLKQKRVGFKNLAAFAALILVVLFTSYWRI